MTPPDLLVCKLVIPATQQARVRVFWAWDSLGKSMRSYLKNKLKLKEMGSWFKYRIFA
jgi:hypothetical protein